MVTLSQVLALPTPSPTPIPRGRGVPHCLRFQRGQQKAAWRQRGAAGPQAGAWPALRGFGSACICVGSGPGRAGWAMNGASVCARRAPLTLLLTELGSFPPPSQNTRACVECVFEKEKKHSQRRLSPGPSTGNMNPGAEEEET